MNGARDIRRGPHFVFIAPVAPLQNHVLILKQPCDTLYSRFQNRLGLATLILAVFKIVWALRHSFWPFSKSIGPSDNHFSRFQNRLGFATNASCLLFHYSVPSNYMVIFFRRK